MHKRYCRSRKVWEKYVDSPQKGTKGRFIDAELQVLLWHDNDKITLRVLADNIMGKETMDLLDIKIRPSEKQVSNAKGKVMKVMTTNEDK